MERPNINFYDWSIDLGEHLHKETGKHYSNDMEKYCDHLQSQLKEAEQVIKTISELNHSFISPWEVIDTVSEMRELADTYLKIHTQNKEDEIS